MVTITKAQAKEKRIEHSSICKFHEHHPDQRAILETCPDCLIIQEPCGCDEDSGCELCNPELKNEVKPNSSQR